jgi:hypothetical protein
MNVLGQRWIPWMFETDFVDLSLGVPNSATDDVLVSDGDSLSPESASASLLDRAIHLDTAQCVAKPGKQGVATF